MIGYININSLQNNLTELWVTIKYLSLDYFVLCEARWKISEAQFTLDCYEIKARRKRNKFRQGLIEYVRKKMICKRIVKYELKCFKCICFEITLPTKKWVIFSIYRPANVENLKGFFEEMTTSLTKVIASYKNILAMGDIKCKGVDSNNLSDFCNLFHVRNIVKFDPFIKPIHH